MYAATPVVISIPMVGIRAAVHNGVDEKTLSVGAGHYPSTGWPGQGRTVGLAGHDVTYVPAAANGHVFGSLRDIRKGMKISFVMNGRRYRYVVTGQRTVDPTDVSVLKDVGHERLVMTTCYPPGSAEHRLVVFAKPIHEPV